MMDDITQEIPTDSAIQETTLETTQALQDYIITQENFDIVVIAILGVLFGFALIRSLVKGWS